MRENLNKYRTYLNLLSKELNKYHEDQKEFLHCKAGCSSCCKTGYYPISELEYEYVKVGFENLNDQQKESVQQKVLDVYKNRKIYLKAGNEMFDYSYECPFLFDDLCSIYDERPLICRTQGLISESLKGANNFNLPACVKLGLNYSNVWDQELGAFSLERAESLNIKTQPAAYEIGYDSLIKKLEMFGYGDIRMIFEWIIMDIPNFQELLEKISKEIE